MSFLGHDVLKIREIKLGPILTLDQICVSKLIRTSYYNNHILDRPLWLKDNITIMHGWMDHTMHVHSIVTGDWTYMYDMYLKMWKETRYEFAIFLHLCHWKLAF